MTAAGGVLQCFPHQHLRLYADVGNGNGNGDDVIHRMPAVGFDDVLQFLGLDDHWLNTPVYVCVLYGELGWGHADVSSRATAQRSVPHAAA